MITANSQEDRPLLSRIGNVAEAAPPVGLVRPMPDHFSAGRWSHFQTAETVCQRDGWARCPTQARLCPACRRFSYKSFPLFCQQIMHAGARRGPTGLHRHPRFAKYTCLYDVQLLAIWRIPLLAVVPLLSLALRTMTATDSSSTIRSA